MTLPHQRVYRRRRPGAAARSALGTTLGLSAAGAAAGTALLALQAASVVVRTPRLPPPPRAGSDFPREGLLARFRERGGGDNDDDDSESEADNDDGSDEEKKEENEDRRPSLSPPQSADEDEFNLVLVGDSPVEGIGCPSHASAMGGQTALAFSHLLGHRHRSTDSSKCRNGGLPVRYWSLGKSGLTAAGIEGEMVPLLREVVASSASGGRRSRRIDAVVVSCGVNNVLSGHSASRFRDEVRSLLRAVRGAVGGCFDDTDGEGGRGRGRTCQIVLLGLPDFSRLPFLPYPLSAVSGWRGRALRAAMEELVEEMREEYAGGRAIAIATVPEVEDLLGGVADDDDVSHPLLDCLELDTTELEQLQVEDFFSDDGFHPGGHGTKMIGTLIAQVYAENIGTPVRPA